MTINRSIYATCAKPVADRLLAAVALVLLLPLLATLAISIRWRIGGPVLFYQMRPGRHGRPFRLVKFRTMTDACDENGVPLDDAARMTPFGRWLRATSLDELPELWNVLRGEMSFVGPRPLLLEYLPLYSDVQRRRHDVRPGITGWAQVHGRNSLSWPERFEHDVWYVENLSLEVDMAILAKTVSAVISRSGISAENHATMPAFTGNSNSRDDYRQAA